MGHWKLQFNVAGSSGAMECFEFEMIIDNFSKLKDVLDSPTFETTRDGKTTWQIIVEVLMKTKKMRVGLRRIDSHTCNVKASILFEIKNDKNEIYWRDLVQHCYSFHNLEYCFGDYLEMPNLQQCVFGIKGKSFKLSSDKIIIKGNVFVKEQKIGCRSPKIDNKFLNENLEDLNRDYRSLYNNPTFSDIEFRFGDEKLLAHKNILSCRSPVFQKTLKQNRFQNIIEITDVEKSVFEMFLLFVYCGVFENRDTNVIIPLYALAYKYEVHALSRSCADILASDISVKTATHILELANTHDDSVLIEISIGFVCENFSQVAQTSEWDKLLSSNPSFSSSVLRRVSKSLSIS